MRSPRQLVGSRPVDDPQRRNDSPPVGPDGPVERSHVRTARLTWRLPPPGRGRAAPAVPGRTQFEEGERRRPEDRAEDGPCSGPPLAGDRDPCGRRGESDEPRSDEKGNDRIDVDTSAGERQVASRCLVAAGPHTLRHGPRATGRGLSVRPVRRRRSGAVWHRETAEQRSAPQGLDPPDVSCCASTVSTC
jgi:hypothetical protein